MTIKKINLLSIGLLLAAFVFDVSAADKKLPGYNDTPVIPGQKWRVHDASRPRPKVVKAGPSKTLGVKPLDILPKNTENAHNRKAPQTKKNVGAKS